MGKGKCLMFNEEMFDITMVIALRVTDSITAWYKHLSDHTIRRYLIIGPPKLFFLV